MRIRKKVFILFIEGIILRLIEFVPVFLFLFYLNMLNNWIWKNIDKNDEKWNEDAAWSFSIFFHSSNSFPPICQ